MTKNFCAIPFHHTRIGSDGSFNVCCDHNIPPDLKQNIRDHTAQHWFDSKYLQEVRQYFIDDRRHPGCNSCWRDEDSGIQSMRIRTQKEYQILGTDITNPKIKNIELQPSNLCNLSCLMCNEKFSSVIQAENRRLGISKIDRSELEWGPSHYANLAEMLDQGFLVLNVLGGEPFYSKALLDILDRLDPKKTSNAVLQIITNATVYNERWKKVMAKFGLVRLMISLDGVGSVYEYIRYPAQWSEVEKNVDLIQGMVKTKSLIHCTVQNLNILYLDQLIRWCQDRNLHLDLTLLNQPSYLHITNLPSDLRHQAIDNLNKWIETFTTPNIQQALLSFRDMLLRSETLIDHRWQEFKTMIEMRDQLRKNSWRSILPTAE